MKNTICLLLLFSISFTMHSQCMGEEKLTYGGDWNNYHYTYVCPTYEFAFNGDTAKQWNVLNDPIDIYQIKDEIFPIKTNVESQILNFSGSNFFDDLYFVSVQVVFPDSIERFSGRMPSCNLDRCNAKYFFYYNFIPIENVHYHIGIAVNEQGEILNGFNFPAKEDYKMIDKKMTICDILEIVKDYATQIEPIEDIKLHYNEKERRFYWLVSQGLKDLKEGTYSYNELLIDASNRKQVKVVESDFVRTIVY